MTSNREDILRRSATKILLIYFVVEFPRLKKIKNNVANPALCFLDFLFFFLPSAPCTKQKKPDNLEEYINNKICICNLRECFRHSKNKKKEKKG